MIWYRSVSSFILILFAVGFLAGCAGSGAAQQGTMRERIGVASPEDVVEGTRHVLITEHGYRYDREVATTEDMRFITQWMEHTPEGDEQAAGTTACRTRVLVNARPKDRSSGTVRTYTVIFRAEYQVQREGAATWMDAPIPESREAYFDDIVDQMESEMTMGIRSYR